MAAAPLPFRHQPCFDGRNDKQGTGVMGDRWSLPADMNADGVVTISDVGLWTQWFFFLPGDALLAGIMAKPELATFFEITPASYGGWSSGVMSMIAWLIVYAVLGTALERR
jgi:hypothetical protein